MADQVGLDQRLGDDLGLRGLHTGGVEQVVDFGAKSVRVDPFHAATHTWVPVSAKAFDRPRDIIAPFIMWYAFRWI